MTIGAYASPIEGHEEFMRENVPFLVDLARSINNEEILNKIRKNPLLNKYLGNKYLDIEEKA